MYPFAFPGPKADLGLLLADSVLFAARCCGLSASHSVVVGTQYEHLISLLLSGIQPAVRPIAAALLCIHRLLLKFHPYSEINRVRLFFKLDGVGESIYILSP